MSKPHIARERRTRSSPLPAPKQLLDLAKELDVKVNFPDSIDDGLCLGSCDWCDAVIDIAKTVRDRGQLKPVPADEMTFTLAHELTHFIRFQNETDDIVKMTEIESIIYSQDLHRRIDLSRRKKLDTLMKFYRYELAVDWQAKDLLESLGLWKPSMILMIRDTHMIAHRYYQMIELGAYCGAKVSRVKGLKFKNLSKAEFDKQALSTMYRFILLYPQYCAGTPDWSKVKLPNLGRLV
jgi:hypothetical protein